MGRRVNQLNDEIGPKARINFALARRKFHVAQAVFAVPELRRDQLLEKWMTRTRTHRDVTAVRQRHHAQRILEAHLHRHIARHDSDGADIQFR